MSSRWKETKHINILATHARALAHTHTHTQSHHHHHPPHTLTHTHTTIALLFPHHWVHFYPPPPLPSSTPNPPCVTCRQVAPGTTTRQGLAGGRRARPPVPTSTTDARPDPAATHTSASPRHQRLCPRHQRLCPRHHSLRPTSVCRCPHTVLIPIRCLTVTSSCPATIRMTWLTWRVTRDM